MKSYLKVKKLIDEADLVVIGAGYGLSSSAGINYDEETFKNNFKPYYEKFNIKDFYSGSFYEFSSLEEKWAFTAEKVNFSYLSRKASQTYINLYNLVKNKEHFVITTNVDEQFLKAGFSIDNLFRVQGSYNLLQCSVACHNTLYENDDIIKDMLSNIIDCKIPSSLIPKCPKCGSNMDLNLRKDEYFVEDDTWEDCFHNYEITLENFLDKKILLLELGVGYNTPSIIKFPFRDLANDFSNINLIKVNIQDDSSDGELTFNEDCSSFINNIFDLYN